ncbi:MAG: urea carboxylase-associated family protein, partial [Anaerolineales bacterium]
DIEGGQVADLVSYTDQSPQEYLSSPRTMDYNNKIYFSTDDVLYSDQSRPMWTITDDTVGKHCFLFAPCDQRMFEISYGVTEPHPNCFDNLSGSLSHFGIQPNQIFIPFNIFMNFELSDKGEIKIKPPSSKAGDFIDLRAEADLIVGLSACSAYKANDYSFSQIRIEIYSLKDEKL